MINSLSNVMHVKCVPSSMFVFPMGVSNETSFSKGRYGFIYSNEMQHKQDNEQKGKKKTTVASHLFLIDR